MIFFLCALLTLWFFIWVSKAVEIQLTEQRIANDLQELSDRVQEIAEKLSQLENK